MTLTKNKRKKTKKAAPSSRGTSKNEARWRKYARAMGPGLVTGASDDDPSGIATYSQAGAKYGFSFLWTALLTFPLMAAVQEICDRTALATGKGIGELASTKFGRLGKSVLATLLIVLVGANTLNVAADLVAVGSGMNLLHAGPSWIWALVAGSTITVLLALDSFDRIALIFKLLSISLLTYLVVAIIVTHNWEHLLASVVEPKITFDKGYIALLLAILGTTISPYLFFWQSAHRLEDMKDESAGGSTVQPLTQRARSNARLKQRTSRVDVFSGMAFSNVVMFAIIAVSAETLNAHHVTDIQSAAQAAKALRPLAGSFSSEIFAFGFIGSGLLAIPVLAASGSVGLSNLLGKQWGFSKTIRQAPFFYSLVAFGTLGGTALSLLKVNPITLLVFVAVINGITASPSLFVVMRVSGSRDLMGDFVNGKLARTLGWITFGMMSTAAIALFASGSL